MRVAAEVIQSDFKGGIHAGQIYQVTKPFPVNDHKYQDQTKEPDKKPRKVLLEEGEFIEIRYPYAWHFRTTDNQYFQASTEEILEHCVAHGLIWDEIRMENQASLAEILKIRLYHSVI